MSIKDGGPAFPRDAYATDGMSLRAWFAAHAPPAMDDWIDTQWQLDRNKNPHNEPHKPPLRGQIELRAAWAFKWADAMLAQMEKP